MCSCGGACAIGGAKRWMREGNHLHEHDKGRAQQADIASPMSRGTGQGTVRLAQA
jgi:hypothetical protein